jgi:hypothetical protein
MRIQSYMIELKYHNQYFLPAKPSVSVLFVILLNKDFYLIENFPNIFYSSKRYVMCSSLIIMSNLHLAFSLLTVPSANGEGLFWSSRI